MTESTLPPASFTPELGLIRYGSNTPPPERHVVRAGPIQALLENGELRHVTLNGHEAVLRLYAAVRDRLWGTTPAVITDLSINYGVDSFDVRFRAVHDDGDVGFAWDGRIAGSPDGIVTCEMNGEVLRDFLRGRIGFCVLHRMALAGQAVEVEHPGGVIERGHFPARIAPHQPFTDMVGLSHPVGSAKVAFRFSGDLFEMEDHRNWTDASFKTYSTPLRLPVPVKVIKGQRISQSVTFQIVEPPQEQGNDTNAPCTIQVNRSSTLVLDDTDTNGVAPRTLPKVGFAMAEQTGDLTERELDLLQVLRPAHLSVALAVHSDDWESELRKGVRQAAALGCALELRVICGDEGEGLEHLFEMLSRQDVTIDRLMLFPVSGWATTVRVVRQAWALAETAGMAITIGDGSRAFFAEFNRAALPLELLDEVGYAISPQVHAFDNASLVENLEAQASTVASARAIIGSLPLAIGPVTLRPQVNPAALEPEPAPAGDRLPSSVDPRQLSLLGASWTIGSLRSLSGAGVSSVTYYETVGWKGLMQCDSDPAFPTLFPAKRGTIFPVYHVFADIADFADAEVINVATTDHLRVQALALRKGQRLLVLVASFSEVPYRIELVLPAISSGSVRIMDETTVHRATTDPIGFRMDLGRQIDGNGVEPQKMNLDLAPFGIASIQAVDRAGEA